MRTAGLALAQSQHVGYYVVASTALAVHLSVRPLLEIGLQWLNHLGTDAQERRQRERRAAAQPHRHPLPRLFEAFRTIDGHHGSTRVYGPRRTIEGSFHTRQRHGKD